MFGTVAPTPYDLKFSIFGIPVRVHPFFWIVTFLMGRNLHNSKLMLIWVFCVFISILIHELGHALTALYYGWPPHIVLHAFGGYASYQPTGSHWVKGGHSAGRSILISFAGPLAGFLLYAVVTGVEKLLEHQEVVLSDYAYFIFFQMKWINLWWGLVNLLPAYPLDGGQISRAAFSHWRPYNGIEISLKLSFVTAVCTALAAYRFEQINAAFLFGYIAFLNFQELQGGRRW